MTTTILHIFMLPMRDLSRVCNFEGELITGYLSERVQNLIKEWCGLHRKELDENWQRARENKPLNWVEPLR